MDHKEAVKLEAAEKYLLGELSAEEREEYEEHYFECQDCLNDLEALDGLVAACRAVLPETELLPTSLVPRAQEDRPGWFSWLKPALALPVIFALVGIILFQNLVTVPAAREQGQAQFGTQAYEKIFRLQGATRGSNGNTVALEASESFALEFDFTPSKIYERYQGSLVDPTGKGALSFNLDGKHSNKEVYLVIPEGKVRPGKYELIFSGQNGTRKQIPENTEVQRISFVVENRPE